MARLAAVAVLGWLVASGAWAKYSSDPRHAVAWDSPYLSKLRKEPLRGDLKKLRLGMAVLVVSDNEDRVKIVDRFAERAMLLRILGEKTPWPETLDQVLKDEATNTEPIEAVRDRVLKSAVSVSLLTEKHPSLSERFLNNPRYEGASVWSDLSGSKPDSKPFRVYIGMQVKNLTREQLFHASFVMNLQAPSLADSLSLKCDGVGTFLCHQFADKVDPARVMQAIRLVEAGRLTPEVLVNSLGFNIDEDQVFVDHHRWLWNDRGAAVKEAAATIEALSCGEKGSCRAIFSSWAPLAMWLAGGTGTALLFFLLFPRRMFWGIAFGLYVLVAIFAVLVAFGSLGSMAMMLTVPALLTYGAPWSAALFVIAGYMLSELPIRERGQFDTLLLLGVPFLGLLVNAWLLGLQFWRSAPGKGAQGAEAAPRPLSASQKIWWVTAFPGALFLCYSYVISIWGERYGFRASYMFGGGRAVPLAETIVLLNCWVLFFNWRRRRFLALAALALPLLVVGQESSYLLPEWSWRWLWLIWSGVAYVFHPVSVISTSWGFWAWLPIFVLVCVAGIKFSAFVGSSHGKATLAAMGIRVLRAAGIGTQ